MRNQIVGLAVVLVGSWLSLAVGQDAPRKVVPAGGWSVDNGAFAISYQPTRHEDGFMKSWLSISAEHAEKSAAASNIFKQLADKKQAGQCMKCHTADRMEDGSMVVQWAGSSLEDRKHKSTRFSHAPHLLVLKSDAEVTGDKEAQSGSCFTCHQLNGQTTDQFVAKYFTEHGKLSFDPHVGASNFAPISKSTCASCHEKNVAGDNCTLCHQYHHR